MSTARATLNAWDGQGESAYRLANKGYDITYYNLGVREETSSDIAARWQNEVLRRLPENGNGRVVFSFGTNDTTLKNGKTRVELSQSIDNAYNILSLAQQFFPTLMVGLPPLVEVEQNSRNAELSQQFALVCSQLTIPYLDIFKPLSTSEVWLNEVAANDSYHPTSAGDSELARWVQNWWAWLSWFKS